MKETTIKIRLGGLNDPYLSRFDAPGWANPAGEIYRVDDVFYLALCNSASTGYTRAIFKNAKSAINWIKRRLVSEFSSSEVKFELDV